MTLADAAIGFAVLMFGACGLVIALWFVDPTRRSGEKEPRE